MRHARVIVAAALVVAAAAGCTPRFADVRGQAVPRVRVGYTDHRWYAVMHRAAYPEAHGASSGLRAYAGTVDGRVCGTSVWYDADYRGRYVRLLGYVEPIDGSTHPTTPAQFEVRDGNGERHIIGSVGNQGQLPLVAWAGHGETPQPQTDGRVLGDLGNPEYDSRVIDFAFDSERLHGVIGPRRFALVADGHDNLVGTVAVEGTTHPFVIEGVSQMWAMPAVDQAAILPLMLTCNLVTDDPVSIEGLRGGHPLLRVSFATSDIARP